jgi:hypothetical protein
MLFNNKVVDQLLEIYVLILSENANFDESNNVQ